MAEEAAAWTGSERQPTTTAAQAIEKSEETTRLVFIVAASTFEVFLNELDLF